MSIFSWQNSFSQGNGSGITLFFEKVYLHVDRAYYGSGDDIWFKAYLVNARGNYPINTSHNLYVELINPVNKIISRKVIRLDDGIGVGDFKLDDSIAGGSYRIRAYTNWIRNFGSHFVFEKEIHIKNIPGVNKVNAIAVKNTSFEVNLPVNPQNKIQFFPEGGTMVEGISSLIAFKAEDGSGNGINAKGFILSGKGDTVLKYNTTHLGMGSFNFKSEADIEYKAWVQYNNAGVFIPAVFPFATLEGFVIKVDGVDTASIVVNVFSNAATLALHPGREITVAAKQAGKIYFKEKVLLKDANASVKIPKKDFPTGIVSITLYDEKLLPYCERLVYFQDKDSLIIHVSPDKYIYGGKEKVSVNISVTDVQMHPVKTSLSMAVIDDGMESSSKQNILSYLGLQSEVAGKIENASAYFDENNPQRFQQLDLLLRTQGWRSFLWRQMADINIHLKYLPEPGITVSGRVKQLLSKKPIPDLNITLQAPAAKGDKFYMTKTHEDGRFYLDGLPLYGTQTIKINNRNSKGKMSGQMFMDTLFGDPLPVSQNYLYRFDTSVMRHFGDEATKRYDIAKNNTWYHVLPAVVITNKRKTVSLNDGTYMSFGYPEQNFTITSADYKYETLQDFLARKVSGASYDVENNGVYFMAGGKIIRPRFVVDKREDVFDRIDYYYVPMNQVISVSVRHLLGQPTLARNVREDGTVRDLGTGFNDIFVIYLELRPGAYNQDPGKVFAEVTGYNEARVFYSPNYETLDNAKPDVRTTIHWEPLITTDANGKATVNFYNSDIKTKVRIDVQGITDKGNPVVVETRYEVK